MFVALRDIRYAKGRFALMSGVVTLITFLIVFLSGLTAGLADQNISAVQRLPATHLAFDAETGRSFGDGGVTDRQVEQWRRQPGVRSAHPLGITQTRARAGGTGLGVTVFGGPDAGVLLSRTAATALRVSAGDPIEIGGERLTVTRITADRWYSHTPVVRIPLDAWRKLDGARPGVAGTVIALSLEDGVDPAAGDRAARTLTATTGDAVDAIGSYSAENGSLTLMRGFLFAISALVIGAFFTVWTVQRRGDIAVLRALGGSGGYLVRDALVQALLVLAAGAGLGGAAGAAAGAVASGSVPFALTLSTTLAPALGMIALGMLGAALAVYRITSVDPLTALGAAR